MSENFHENENINEEEIKVNENETVEYTEEIDGKPVKHVTFSENTSGYGAKAAIPGPVGNRFNWGAFLMTWVWGICNNSYIPVVFLIPLLLTVIAFINISMFTFVMLLIDFIFMTWFGIRGNIWAWQNKRYESIAIFHEIQKKWAIGSLIFFVLCAAIFAQQVATFVIKFNELFAGA